MKNLYHGLLAMFALAFLAQSLHLHDASSNYISYLQSQQNTVKTKLEDISKKLSQNYNNVQKENDIDKKIALLQKYLKQQRLLLAEINLETVNQQLNQSEWVCPVLSDTSKKQINDDISSINKDLGDINRILVPLSDQKYGPGIQSAKQEIKSAEKIADNLKDALGSKGTEVEASSLHPDKKPNLNAQNWILDGKSIDQLNEQYKKAAESGALQICGIQEPFYSSKVNKCIACTGSNQYFSMRTSQCVECSNFDVKQHRCKDNQGAATNITPLTEDRIIVPMGKTLDDYKKAISPNTVVCPDKAPFYTGSDCIQCESFFDIQSKQCKKCQGNSNYDRKTHTCNMPQVTVSNIDAGKSTLIIPNDKALNDILKDNKKLEQNSQVITCPKQKPYFNDYECIGCAEGTLFSLIQKSCGTCQSGTFFNKDTNHCQKKSFYSNLQDPNWASTLSYPQIQKEIQEKTKNPLYEKCPVEKPFSTGKECIQCNSDQHFDYDKKQCTKCYNGQTFNKNLHNCTYTQNNFQTNPQKTSNLIFEGRPKNEWMYIYYQNIEQNEGMTDCPKEKPFFDGVSCIICPSEHPYFNLEYKMCQKCSEGTKYEEAHHECLTTQGNIATQVPTLQKMAAGIFS